MGRAWMGGTAACVAPVHGTAAVAFSDAIVWRCNTSHRLDGCRVLGHLLQPAAMTSSPRTDDAILVRVDERHGLDAVPVPRPQRRVGHLRAEKPCRSEARSAAEPLEVFKPWSNVLL